MNAGLREGRRSLLERDAEHADVHAGVFGAMPTFSNYSVIFTAAFSESGGRGELGMKMRYVGPPPIGYPRDGATVFAAIAESTGAGTKITTHGLAFGYGDLNPAVEAWAKSGSTVCPPTLPM